MKRLILSYFSLLTVGCTVFSEDLKIHNISYRRYDLQHCDYYKGRPNLKFYGANLNTNLRLTE